MTKHQINGIVLLDKPLGLSSNQALQKVKKIFDAKKAGHTGTLDPLATGMLPILLGEATKFAQFLLDANKIYQFEMQLGAITDTGDSEGKIIKTYPLKGLDDAVFEKIIQKFEGRITQIPPKYSAIKVAGKPLYQYARENQSVEIKPREITIHKLSLLNYDDHKLSFEVSCSKGTYIRSLAQDIGEFLGMGAYVSQLRRVATGPFKYENNGDYASMAGSKKWPTFRGLIAESSERSYFLEDYLIPIDAMLLDYKPLILTDEQVQLLYYGQRLIIEDAQWLDAAINSRHVDMGAPDKPKLLRLYNPNKQFLGLGEVLPNRTLKSVRLLQPNV